MQPHMRTPQGNRVIREDDHRAQRHLDGRRRDPLQPRRHAVPDACGCRRGSRPGLSPACSAGPSGRPTAPMPVSARMRARQRHFSAYGYGWRLSDVDGAWKVAHTGTLAGMYSSVILLPDQRTGIVILINGEEPRAIVLGQVLTKQITRLARRTAWRTTLRCWTSARANAPPSEAGHPSSQPCHRGGAVSLDGRYRDPWFGDAINLRAGRSRVGAFADAHRHRCRWTR